MRKHEFSSSRDTTKSSRTFAGDLHDGWQSMTIWTDGPSTRVDQRCPDASCFWFRLLQPQRASWSSD
jgi:hypothetical protein